MTIMNDAFAAQLSTANNRKAICEFRQARLRGKIRRVWATMMGQSAELVDVKTVTQGRSVRCRHYAGGQTVDIRQIQGSEGRCQDFDLNFNPLKDHNQNRWVGIANAWDQGIYLPAVELIKIGDVYIVRDGHHRISVAKFKGCNYVDARVTEWQLAG